MKRNSQMVQAFAIILSATIFLAGCGSTTMIQSKPDNAKVYLNGEYMGTTPYAHRDTKIVGSTTIVTLEKEGYQTFNTSFSRDEELDVGALIGGLFLLVPFLWIMKYKPFRNYEMKPEFGYEEKLNSETLLEINN
ncbi:PEGA domain-containing protein [Aquiflexum balticum DSM 16537]|uniref:PEGA domain-containing protein n=1 Tax=Aquiflexum balticum DSM 16537 TaxID=758820 RepID=A0A1W2H4K5_9BACT|nr:PEGA domain-containing protein [Aquiflexum balticum]SMD43831.1 PEGA domain-containing protein [Aquiflexum balticum DSM 16537]